MSNKDGNWPRSPDFGPRFEITLYGIGPGPGDVFPPIPPFPSPFPPIPPGVGTGFVPATWVTPCGACSDSRIRYGATGPEPCPACCPKLIAALKEDAERKAKLRDDTRARLADVEQHVAASFRMTRTEINRLKAKCNRLLRKLRKSAEGAGSSR